MKRKIQIVIFVLCLCVLGISAFKLYDIQNNYEEGDAVYNSIADEVVTVLPVEEETEQKDTKDKKKTKLDPMISVDLKALKQKNEDIIGWLYIPNSVISYPLLQGENNDTYLHQTYNKQQSFFGSIFIDYRNNSNLQDAHTIIYGHNMKNGSMFGTLKRYSDKAFYKEHKNIYIYTEKGTHKYQVFSYHVADATGKIYRVSFEDENALEDYLKLAKQSSYLDTGVEVGTSDKTITLSTCTSNESSRFVVHAKYVGDVE